MDTVTMSKKELRYGEIISQAVVGKISQSEASLLLGLSIRQVKRLYKKYKQNGMKGLAHKNRGRASNNTIQNKDKILQLIKMNYSDFSYQLISEMLIERHGITVSAEWVRNLLLNLGLRKIKSRNEPKIHQPRNRRSRRGELIQIDGSYHDWFEDRSGKCCLLVAIDDATSEIKYLRFVKHETTDGYMNLMTQYTMNYGLPSAFYSDRLNALKKGRSHISRSLSELNIGLINANSPQAKGRVERANGTLQDRLIKLMRLEGISSMEEGNNFLESYIHEHNNRFARKPMDNEDAHRPVPSDANLGKIFSEKEFRKVTKSLTVQYKGKTYVLDGKRTKNRLIGKTAVLIELSDEVYIEIDGVNYDYRLQEELPYYEPMNRKEVDAWLDRKKPLTIIEKYRRGIRTNF